MHFLILLVIFAIIYFGMILPVFQIFSRRLRGRKFVIRLGTPWKLSNAEHRWDVLLSFVSFMITMGLSFLILDLYFPLAEVAPR